MEKKTTKTMKSTSKVNKTKKVDNKIKQQVKEEKNNKKIIIISLILALLVAIFAYWQISKSNEEEKKSTENKNEVVEKEDQDVSLEEDDDTESAFIEYVEEYVKPVKVEKVEEEKEDIYYSISFETNGGNNIEKQILTQDEVTSLVLPIKEGWVFQGWYKDSEFTELYTFGNALSEDTTIYAKWGKYISYMYQETLYEKENIISENETIPFLAEEKTEATPEGYVLGWFIEEISESGEVVSSIEVLEGTLLTEEVYSHFDSEEIVLTAKYLEKFNIEFFEDEAVSEVLHTQEVVEGRVISFEEVGAVVKEKFVEMEEFGWYYLDENSTKWNVSADQKADKTIIKLYLDETYTLIYTEEPDEDTIVTEEDKTTPNGNIILKEENVSKDSQIKEEDIFKPLEKEGYEFMGWFLVDEVTGEATEEVFTEETIIDGDKIYVAKWKELVVDEVLENNTELTEESEPAEELEVQDLEVEAEVVEDTEEEPVIENETPLEDVQPVAQ